MTEQVAEHREKLCGRLKAIRGERSQNAFAKELGVFQQNINRFESGKSAPHVDFLIHLAIAENVDLNWLLVGRKPRGQR